MTPPASTRQLRVTFLATVLTPQMGMENAVLRLAAALARQGHRAEILVLHDPGSLDVPGVTVTSLDAGTEPASRRALRRRLRTSAPEALVVTGVWAGAQLLLAAPWRFRSAVAWEHSVTPHRLTTGRRFRLRAETVARCYRLCAAVISVSPVVASTLRERWGVESVVVPNLLDLPAQSPGARRHAGEGSPRPMTRGGGGPVRLLALGEAKPVKNYDVLVRALPLLDVDWRLRMVGGGSQEPELRALAASLGVADRVQWLGHVANPAPLLADSDLLVHPSASETFGYVLFEAAEEWLPVVATDAPVMNSLVPDLVPGVLGDADPPSLAAAIGTALRRFGSPDAAEAFVAADERRRRRYGSSATVAAWETVLRDRG